MSIDECTNAARTGKLAAIIDATNDSNMHKGRNPCVDVQPIKKYHLTRQKYWSYKQISIQQDSQQIYNVVTGPQVPHSPQITIFSNEKLLATARLRPATKSFRIKLGPDIDCTPIESWTPVESESKLGRSFRFEVQGKTYRWKRTHKEEWGAKWWAGGNFKLVDEEERVLVVYLTANVVTSLNVASMSFFADLSEEVELASLAAVLGILERIRRE